MGLPSHGVDGAALADLELLLSGALGPPAYGPDLPLVAPGVEADTVELTDPEGLPLARLTVTRRAGDVLEGPLEPLGEPAYGVFRSLQRPARARRGMLVDRPLLPSDDLTGVDLLLVTLSPDGVPAEVLVRCALATGIETVLVPLRPGTGLGPRVAAAYVDELVPLPAGAWPATRAALDAGSTVDAPAELLRWRPPLRERGVVVFFTGLSGSGKSTLARALTDRLLEDGRRRVTVLDGDVVRRELSAGLGFSKADRDLNVRRIGWVAAEVARHGGVAVCAPIAPYAATRAHVRAGVEAVGDFVLVHVATPLEVCEARDRKGLYAQARAGLITGFTGVDDPYEEPDDADLVLDTSVLSVPDALDALLERLRPYW